MRRGAHLHFAMGDTLHRYATAQMIEDSNECGLK